VAFRRKRVTVPESEQSSTKFSTELATDQAQRFRDATDRIRERTDLAAKALGGLALTGFTAIGIAKIADVFPYPPGEWPYLVALFGGFLFMLGGVAIFTYRLWSVGQKVVLRPDPDLMTDLKGSERVLVRTIYDEFAELNNAPSLRAFVARAFRWQRIADSLEPNDVRAQPLRDRAQLVLSEALATQTRAGMIVARMRASDVIKGPEAVLAYLFFFVGVLSFGIAADRIDSERTQRVTVAKSCADAVTAGAKDLPAICGTPSKPQPTTPTDAAGQGVVAIATALQKCLSAAEKTNKPRAICQPLRTALAASAK
jgi:hypothetical protein